MLREVIRADTGIIFSRNKLMKFGVPEFALKTTGNSAIVPQIKGADHPQQPSVATGSHAISQEENAKGGDNMVPSDTSSTLTNDGSDAPWWYRDSVEPLRDELLHQPGWWLLEVLPFYVKKQDENSIWKKHIWYVAAVESLIMSSLTSLTDLGLGCSINRFRPRVIPKPPHENDPNHVRYSCCRFGNALKPISRHLNSTRMLMPTAPTSRHTLSFMNRLELAWKLLKQMNGLGDPYG